MVDKGAPEVRVRRKPVPIYQTSQHHRVASAVSEASDISNELITYSNTADDDVEYRDRRSTLLTTAKEVPSATVTSIRDREDEHEPRVTEKLGSRSTTVFPSWTSPISLAAFCALFVLVLATLALLSALSRSRDGFDMPLNVSPYAWKYGPTAVMTVIAALWRQVDRQTKTDQPWIELSTRPRPSSQNLLLDYSSPILPIAFWTSLRNKHWRVAMAITISVLLKIAVAFSTGLIVVRNITSTTSQVPMTLQRPYQGPDPVLSSTDLGYYLNLVYGNIAYGLEYPSGTSAHAAYQVLSPSNRLPPDAMVTAEVTAAFPSLLCEPATLIANYSINHGVVDGPDGQAENRTTASLNVYFNSRYCYGSLALGTAFNSSCMLNGTGCTSDIYYVSAARSLDCFAFQDAPNFAGQTNAFVFALLALSPPEEPGGSFTRWSSGAVCQANYAIETANLTGNSFNIGLNNDFVLSDPLFSTQNTLPYYSPGNITNEISSCLLDEAYGTPSTPPKSSSADYTDVEGYFNLMLAEFRGSDITVFQIYSVMVGSASQIYQRFAAYMLSRQLALLDNLDTQGSYSTSVPKLFILGSSVWIVTGIMCTAILLTIGIMLMNISHGNKRSPSSLSELSACAPRGSMVSQLLSGTGRMTLTQISDRLSRHVFSAVPTSDRCIKLQGRPLTLHDEQEKDEDTHEAQVAAYWVPFSLRKWFVMVCIVVPIVEIIVLEVLQRRSDTYDGISDMHESLHTSQNIAALLPATIMLSTAALYSAVEWSTGVFTPFSLARKGPVLLKWIDRNFGDAEAPTAMFKTLRNRQYGAFMIIVSTLLGSFLTIASSGLYSLQVVPRPLNVSLQTTTQFNTSWDKREDLPAANLFSLIELHNASYPDGTFKDIAFPHVRFNDETGSLQRVIGNANFVDIDITVLRARLNCTVPPQENIFYSIKYPTNGYNNTIPQAHINVTTSLPHECQYSSGIYQNTSQITASFDVEVSSPFLGSIELGKILYIEGSASGVTTPNTFPPYCPSIVFAVGSFRNDTSTANKTVLVCTQLQQEIPATLRFKLPGFSLDQSTLPRLDESRARIVSGHQYQFESIFGVKAEAVDVPSAESSDVFYQTIVSMNGMSISDMVGPDNEGLFYNETESLYQAFMAQLFGTAMRETDSQNSNVAPATETTPINTVLNGTTYDSGRMRVIQHRTSKIVLQALLAVMVLCAIVAFSVVRTRNTLPHNPCSIAGKLSLFLGGRFAEECADIAGLCDDAEEPGRRLQDSEVKLGWQTTDEGADQTPWFGLDFVPTNTVTR